MITFVCPDTFEGVLSGVFDAWDSHIPRNELKIEAGPICQRELFTEYREVYADSDKAKRVMNSIRSKISWQAYRQCMNCAMSAERDRGDVIYRFLLLGFTVGKEVTKYLQEPAVMRLFEYSRKLGNEAHYYREFIRFNKWENGVYISHISPSGDVLSYVANHFSDRMPSEDFMIIDDRRKTAVIHPREKKYYIRELTEEEFLFLKNHETDEDQISNMWRIFFHTISIKERENFACQRNHLPLHFRKHMTEFL